MLSSSASLQATFEALRASSRRDPYPEVATRRAWLRGLARFLRQNEPDVLAAISRDYGYRSSDETQLIEIYPALAEIEHALDGVGDWMRPRRRDTDWRAYPGARNEVTPQPLGLIGIVVPWNYPVFLSFGPLVAALAAGNRAMVKMSTNSRHLAQLLADKMPQYVPDDCVRFLADPELLGREFTALPFDHLIFTGSGTTGSSVMAAAARNLCGVTLELGGKSPALVLPDFDLRTATDRIMFGKLMNAGQTCVGVDYAMIPAGGTDTFVARAQQIVVGRYGNLESTAWTSIIDRPSFLRLTDSLQEAAEAGARVINLLPGPAWEESGRRLAPHLVIDPPDHCALSQRETFGPILVLRTYDSVEAAVAYINARPRPLAFYPFTLDRRRLKTLLREIISGGVTVNDTIFHVAQTDLPFGGVGASGIGSYHGRDGFLTCSKLRPVFYQSRWFNTAPLLSPPYGKVFRLIYSYLRFVTRP